jgi:hypothetical protein
MRRWTVERHLLFVGKSVVVSYMLGDTGSLKAHLEISLWLHVELMVLVGDV